MKALIVPIGNSKGIRIPKVLLEESGIEDEVELKVGNGILRVIPIKKRRKQVSDTALASEVVLRRDWGRPEEDEAWANL